MGKKIGIDLGTSNSVAAIAVASRPNVLESRENHPQTKSVVSLRKRKGKDTGDGEILVGDTALDNWPLNPKNTIISVKRLMGRGMADNDVKRVQSEYLYEVVSPSDGTRDSIRVMLGGKEYKPEDISAMILRKIKEDSEYRLGEEVSHAVITVPAYFSQIQKEATRKAAIQAGLKVLKILEEPTAAAIAFGLDCNNSDEAKTLLVYDFGGGTFDISILMWANNVFAPLNLEGDMWLGGDNFDQVLVNHTIKYVREEYGIDPTANMRFMAALKNEARKAKERLSSARSADILLTGLLMDEDNDLIDVDLEVTREVFERLVQPLVDKTTNLVKQALTNANLTQADIDYVLMAGNSTSIPLVQKAMEDLFGSEKIMRNIHPKHCVAQGAAVLAARTDENSVICCAADPSNPERECGHPNPSDASNCEKCGEPLIFIGNIAPYSYGVQSADDKYHVFIRKGDSYPTEDPLVQSFYTRMANQRMISIPVFGGEHLEKASANEKQGEAFAILPPSLVNNTPIHIKIWLNRDGEFDLSAELDNGESLQPWIMHGETDQKAVEAIEDLNEKIKMKGKDLHPEQRKEIEKAKEKAFEKLKQKEYNEAINLIENLDMNQPQSNGPDINQRAQGLINYTEGILGTYGWALDPNKAYQLTNLIAETKRDLASNNPALLAEDVKKLDEATDDLPGLVNYLINTKFAIDKRINPYDPQTANKLRQELQMIENDFRNHDASAEAKLVALLQKVTEAIERLKPKGEDNCPKCQAEIHGRFCKNCGFDTWGMDSGNTPSGRTHSLSRL